MHKKHTIMEMTKIQTLGLLIIGLAMLSSCVAPGAPADSMILDNNSATRLPYMPTRVHLSQLSQMSLERGMGRTELHTEILKEIPLYSYIISNGGDSYLVEVVPVMKRIHVQQVASGKNSSGHVKYETEQANVYQPLFMIYHNDKLVHWGTENEIELAYEPHIKQISRTVVDAYLDNQKALYDKSEKIMRYVFLGFGACVLIIISSIFLLA